MTGKTTMTAFGKAINHMKEAAEAMKEDEMHRLSVTIELTDGSEAEVIITLLNDEDDF